MFQIYRYNWSMRSFLILILANLFVFSVLAEEKEFNLSKVRNKRNKTPMDVLVLEMQMGESGYQISKSVENKARLLATYERAINEFCFEGLLKTYRYSFDATNIRCADQIAKTLALDSTNPAAICAQSGIDSSACDLAYAGQKTAISDALNQMAKSQQATALTGSQGKASSLVPPAVVESLELQERLHSKRSDIEEQRLKDRVRSFRSSFKAKKTEEDRERLERALVEWISLACEGAEVRYIKNGQNLSRMRLLPSSCLEAVTEGRAFDKNMVAAVCNHEGLYTPNCTKARRQRAAALRPKVTATPAAPGLATF